MGGSNPYIKKVSIPLPTRAYTIRFLPAGKTVPVDPSQLPYNRTGLPGSILEIALGNGVEIDHACGGVCACSTCHVIVRQGSASLAEATDDELDQLDLAPGLTPESRLACQCVPDGSADLVVEVPDWNRNKAKEGPH
jgi:ferredoxin, 2Fe-2S